MMTSRPTDRRNVLWFIAWMLTGTGYALGIRLLPIAAGRTARALLEDELLDVVLSREHPRVIRLTEVLD
jgi:hypothetical protein